MLRDAGVRGKLFAVLAIPTVLLIVASGWLVGGQVQAARQAGQIQAVTDVALQLNRVVHSLQLERTDHARLPAGCERRRAQSRTRDSGSTRTPSSGSSTRRSPPLLSAPCPRASRQRPPARPRHTTSSPASASRSTPERCTAAETDAAYGKIISNDLQLPGAIAASASPELAQRLQAQRGPVDRHRVRLT